MFFLEIMHIQKTNFSIWYERTYSPGTSVCEYTAYIYTLYSIFQFNFISIAAIHNNGPLSAPYIVRYSPHNNREKTTRITQSPVSKNSMVRRKNSFLGQKSLPGNRNYYFTLH